MAETNVTPIKPRVVRKGREFKFPKGIQEVVAQHQWRVCEALAVAKLLSENLREPAREGDFETNTFAADAIIRLLTPVEGLQDAGHLELQAAEMARD